MNIKTELWDILDQYDIDGEMYYNEAVVEEIDSFLLKKYDEKIIKEYQVRSVLSPDELYCFNYIVWINEDNELEVEDFLTK